MIHVTDEAIDLLRTLELPADRVLRLEPVDAEHLGFVLGDAEAGDVVIEKEGHDLLNISAALNSSLPDSVMDRVDTPEGPKVAIVPTDLGEAGVPPGQTT